MFGEDERRARKNEAALDALRGRFGQGAIVTGRDLKRGG